jgi:hypothetical protein
VEVGVLIQSSPQLRILVAIDAIDGRKGIDSLAQICRVKAQLWKLPPRSQNAALDNQ